MECFRKKSANITVGIRKIQQNEPKQDLEFTKQNRDRGKNFYQGPKEKEKMKKRS